MQSIKEKSFEKDSTRSHVKLYQSTAKMHWLFTRHRGTPDLTFNITFSLTQSWMVIWICFLSFPNYDRLVASMAPHSSTLAWKIPWTEETGRLTSMGSLRVGHNWATSLSFFTFHFHALEKEMATHSSVLAWRILGAGEPGGLLSMGSYRVGHDWSDLA